MDGKTYDLLSFVTLFAGVWLGVVPLVVKLLGGDHFRIALTLALPTPYDVVVAVAVVLVAFLLLVVIDGAKKKAGA